MRIVDETISLNELNQMSNNMYNHLVKAVVDTKKGILVVDSMINIRPSWGNNSRSIENPDIQKKIIEIVNKLVTP